MGDDMGALSRGMAAAFLSMFIASGSAKAAVLFEFEEISGNVVGSLSGSLNLVGASQLPTCFGCSNPAHIMPSIGFVQTQSFNATTVLIYTLSGPTSFGPGPANYPDASTASDLLYVAGRVGSVILFPPCVI